MNTVNIPFIDYKMDKIKFITIVIIIVVVILIATNGSGIIRAIVNGIGNAVSGVGEGIVNGINDLTGATAQDNINMGFEKRIDVYWQGSNWVNWMKSDLYNSDPSQITIDQQTAQNLYNNIRSAEGLKLIGVEIYEGDFSGVQQDFANVVGNKFDISYVSYIAEQSEGNSLGAICEAPWNFYNDKVGNSGKSNLQMLAEFLEWANNLPTY